NPHDFTGAQRQYVVGHVADHRGRHDARRLRAGRKEPAPAPRTRPHAGETHHHRDGDPGPVRGGQLPAELAEVDAREQIREQRDAERDADPDADAVAQRPSCARTASSEAGTDVGRDADSSAVSGSFRPCPVSVSTSVEPGSMRSAFTVLTRPATVAAEAGSMKTPSSRASMR